jgi:hypothetical protein
MYQIIAKGIGRRRHSDAKDADFQGHAAHASVRNTIPSLLHKKAIPGCS